MRSSRLPGFHASSLDDRLAKLKDEGWLSDDDVKALVHGVPLETLDRLSENVVGRFTLPLGVATNFLVNGTEVLVPMATEEPSVVAGAANAARMARPHGGFTARAGVPVVVGQVVLTDCDAYAAREVLVAAREEVLAAARTHATSMERRGGGVQGVEARVVPLGTGAAVCIVHVFVDVRDAMGANAVNTLCERLAPTLAAITGGRPLLRILSNKADRRAVKVHATFDAELLGGPRVVDDIVLAGEVAAADPWRAVTHNKGVMNGITAVAVATGNDTRAVEAAAHEHAARAGRYGSLTTFRRTEAGHLEGRLQVPIPVGIVGGATRAHPQAAVAIRMLGVQTSRALAEVMASVGLAQNVAALRALVAEGIQEGHMRLHGRRVGEFSSR